RPRKERQHGTGDRLRDGSGAGRPSECHWSTPLIYPKFFIGIHACPDPDRNPVLLRPSEARKLGSPELATGPGRGSPHAQRPPGQPQATLVGAVVRPLLREPVPERRRDLPRRPVEQVVDQPVHRQECRELPTSASLRRLRVCRNQSRPTRSSGSTARTTSPRHPPTHTYVADVLEAEDDYGDDA